MKTITTHHESTQPKPSFGTRLLFIAFLLSLVGFSKGFAQAPANNDCANAISITPSTACNLISGSTLNASASISGTTCAGNADDDVWYSFVATTTNCTINVQGAGGFDAVVNVRAGTCSSTTSIICKDATANGGLETMNLSNLNIGTTYFIRVYHYFAGSGSGSFQICVQTPVVPTLAPFALTATNNTCTSFTANWTAVSGATTYYLDISTSSSFTSFLPGFNNINTNNVTNYNVTGLTSGITYYYRVRAGSGNGVSSNSNTMGASASIILSANTEYNSDICSGDSTRIELLSSDPNTVFSWSVTGSPNINGYAAGTGNIIQQLLTFTSAPPLGHLVVYMITATNGCSTVQLQRNVEVFECAPALAAGASFSSTQNGAVVNTRCDLDLCINSSITNQSQYNYFHVRDSALNLLAQLQPTNQGVFCPQINQYYTFALGYNTFYLTGTTNNGIIYFYDTITYNITAPIVLLANQVSYTETAQPNGVYDYTISNLSPSESYTIVLSSYMLDNNDTLLVTNTTTATISHQYPHDGTFGCELVVIADCDSSMFSDQFSINVTNSSCSSYIEIEYASVSASANSCGANSANMVASIRYDNLNPNDSSLIAFNWGDGNTDYYYASHGGNASSYMGNNFSQHYLSHTYSAPGVYTVLLTIYNANACYLDTLIQSITIGSNTCGNLTGTIFNDVNTNCALNSGTDIGLANQLITATNSSNNVYYAWSNYMGNYAFNTLPNGTYTVNIANLNLGYAVTCSGVLPATITVNSNTQTLDVPVSCTGAYDLAITGISLWHGFFPGQPDKILPHVGILNSSCSPAVVAGQVKIVLDACIQYTTTPSYSHNGAPDAVIPASTGDTLVWNVADINNIGNFGYYDYAVNTLTCTTAQVGDSACITMIVSPTNGDADPSNNAYTRCFEIGVSYDPNNKEVDQGVGVQGIIPANEPSLTYTLNFQNTGTAQAWNIYVMDTIDTDLDINSIEILSASHRMQVYTLPNRAIKFMFPNIMLADSTHDEPNSHGYVTFKIKLNAGLAPATQIHNTGHIYFDYNEAIVTNTTLNTIETPSSVQGLTKPNSVKVYPNPAKDAVVVVSTINAEGTITITDLIGKTVKEEKVAGLKNIINTSNLQSGVYFIKLTQGNTSSTQKIVISK